MARGVGDDELACRSLKVAVGHVYSDALLAFGTQTIGEQREIDGTTRTIEAAIPHRGQLIFIHGFRVMQEPSDERGFAVIDAAGSGKAQHVFLQMMIDQMLKRSSQGI